MKHRIALITDSTCDIPEDWRKEYDITVIPLTIIWDNREYLDGVDISPEEFYERLENDPNRPTTSQAGPSVFVKAYQEAADKGYQEILVITISSAMSGTIQSARQAVDQSPIPVHIVDGKNNSMGLGWQIIAAARVRQNGGSLQEMLDAAEKVRNNMVYYISLNTMEYLVSGGRVGDAVKFLNSVVKIKPLVLVKPDTGTVGASVPARSRKGAIDGLFKTFLNILIRPYQCTLQYFITRLWKKLRRLQNV